MRALLKKVVFSLITLILVILTVEGVLFLVGFMPKSPPFLLFEGNPERSLAEKWENYDGKKEIVYVIDDVVFWRFKPSNKIDINPHYKLDKFYSLYTINSHGFRGVEFKEKKQRDTYRIIVLGDSISFGLCVPEEKTYYKLLEKMLHEAFPPLTFEVISVGIPGYTSFQGLQLLKSEILSYSPDMIIINFGGNNEFARGSFTDREYAQMISSSFLEKWSRKARTLGLLKSLSQMLKSTEADRKAGRNTASSRSTLRVPQASFLEDLIEMKMLAEKSDIETIFVVPPHSDTNLRWQPVAEGYTAIVRYLGNHYPVADVDSQFKKRDSDALFTKDYFHPNENGHRIIAETLFKVVSEKIGQFFERPVHVLLAHSFSKEKANEVIEVIAGFNRDKRNILFSEALLTMYMMKSVKRGYEIRPYKIRVVDGYLGKAVYFNGNDAFIETSLNLSNLTSFSVGFWIKPDQQKIGDIVTVLDNGHDEKQDCALQLVDATANTYTFHCFGVDSIFRLSTDLWTHILIVVDLKSRYFCVYLNGEKQSDNKLLNACKFGSTPLTFGKLAKMNNRYFKGTLDEIIVWGKALNEEDVRVLDLDLRRR